MTIPLCERLRAEAWVTNEDGGNVFHEEPVNPDGPEAAALIEELTSALEQAAYAMTCRRDDDAHYCPNCDSSLYEAREKARAALSKAVSNQQ